MENKPQINLKPIKRLIAVLNFLIYIIYINREGLQRLIGMVSYIATLNQIEYFITTNPPYLTFDRPMFIIFSLWNAVLKKNAA